MKKIVLLLFTFCLVLSINAQNVTLKGYTFEDNNRGFVAGAYVTLTLGEESLGLAITDAEGAFEYSVQKGKTYHLKISKEGFNEINQDVIITEDEVTYLKIPITRKPGYVFEGYVLAQSEGKSDAVEDIVIQQYNNTEDILVKRLDKNSSSFNLFFESGNQYSLLISKAGFFTKRVEVNVNANGCILCFTGLDKPNISNVMTRENTAGTITGVMAMDSMVLDQTILIENIYYDLGKANIRKDAALELDKLITILEDNPAIIIELGSHTDARGDDASNKDLSQRRADSARAYLIDGGIEHYRIASQGYGESKLKNGCRNGVQCSESKHQVNRRTDFKVVAIDKDKVPVPNPRNHLITGDSINEPDFLGFESGEEYVAPEVEKTIVEKKIIIEDSTSEMTQNNVDLIEKVINKPVYSIYIMNLSYELPKEASLYSNFDNIWMKKEGEEYHYYYGKYEDKLKAIEAQNLVHSKGYMEAYLKFVQP